MAIARSVLIVEDHPLVAHAMRGQLLHADATLHLHISTDASAAKASLFASGTDWFRVFLDLDVPGAYGLSLAREIQSAGMQRRCCVVTAFNKPDLITEIEQLGFLGYLVKAMPYADFDIALRRVLSGDRAFAHTETGAHLPVRLTRRQEQLLDLVRQGQSSKEIARTVSLSEGSVNNCINAAMSALSVSSRSHAVARALELGLLSMTPTALRNM